MGVVIGSLLPDTDAKDSKIHYMGSIPQFFGAIMSPWIFPVMRRVFGICKIPFNPEHRKSLHTVFGVIVYTAILSLLIFVVLVILGQWHSFVLLFMFGLLFGGFLHIAEDCCTKSGCTPLYPFSRRKLSGRIITGNKRDRRPDHFAELLIFLLVAIMVGQIYCIILNSISRHHMVGVLSCFKNPWLMHGSGFHT